MKRKKLILVVDDDEEMLRMLSCLLELEGYDVAIAADGRAAVALLEEREPDLVILDIVMPVLDGLQVLSLIRQRSKVPVIVLTAKREVTTLCSALVLGADDYVKKPFHTPELLARIKAKLRRTWSKATPSVPIKPIVLETRQPEQPFPTAREGTPTIPKFPGKEAQNE